MLERVMFMEVGTKVGAAYIGTLVLLGLASLLIG